MEYIIVHFDPANPRDVLANGNPIGSTGAELTLPADYYVITLSGTGYQPPEWSRPISGTQPKQPLPIVCTHG